MTSQSLFSLSDNFLPEETGSGNTGNKFTGFWGLGWFKICMLAAADEGSYKLNNILHSFHFHEFFENIPRLTHRVMNWIMHWSIGGRWLFGGLLWWNGLSLTLGSVFIGSGITSTSGSGPLVLILGSGKKIGNPIVWIHTFFWSLSVYLQCSIFFIVSISQRCINKLNRSIFRWLVDQKSFWPWWSWRY